MVTLKEAKEVAKRLIEEIEPEALIVFGSVAREGKGEDLDLLIVTDKEEDTVKKALKPFYHQFAIDYLTVTAKTLDEEFKKGSPFLRLIQREGRALYMKDSLRQWRELALEDFAQARYLFEGGYWRGVCFNAQQAMEKAIKAELLARGWELERIHNIRRLLTITKDYGISVKIEDEDIDFIDAIYRGRYPAEEGLLPLKTPSREDAERALRIAESLLSQLNLL